MKLFRVYDDSAVASFLVSNPSGLSGVSGASWLFQSGNLLLNTSMIVDMGERELKFSNGPETIQHRERAKHSTEIESLIRKWD